MIVCISYTCDSAIHGSPLRNTDWTITESRDGLQSHPGNDIIKSALIVNFIEAVNSLTNGGSAI